MKVNANLPDLPVPGAAPPDHDALPAGTRFGEFEIIRVLGVGGFGIVYLAQDHSLERQVALKEYMPAALAARGVGPMITVRAGAFAATFGAGLRSFINEARLLARFDHPSLVKVYRFWEDNGTAYMVMPYLQGRTLRDARRAMGHPPDETWVRGVLGPLLDALEQLHGEGVFHRDIAPDNILLPPGALPILLDFGAARRVINDRTQSLTAIVKPSYAPIEQYAEMAAMRQGPWTDIYALGAVLHYLLFGVPPAPATARAVQPEMDQNEPIERRVVPGVSPRFLGIVRWMLGVRPLERPQSVAALRAVLNGAAPVPVDALGLVAMPGEVPALAAVLAGVAAPVAPVASAWAVPATGSEPVRVPASAPAPASAPEFATTRPGSAPLRSTPPGTLPPAFVPPGRSAPAPAAAAAVAVAPVESDPIDPTVIDKPRIPPRPADPGAPPRTASPASASVPPILPASTKPSRRVVLAGAVTAGVIAVGVLWQFIGLISGPRQVLPPMAAASGAIARFTHVVPAGSATAARVPVAAEAPAPRDVAEPRAVTSGEPTDSVAASSRPRGGIATAQRPAPVALRNRVERGPASAAQACSGRNFFSRAVCMDRECERPRFRASAECARVLEVKRRRTVEH